MAPPRRKKGGWGKWRQQKLAVGTVQKIARAVAKQEDNKRMEWRVHQRYVIQTGGLWTNQILRPTEAVKRRYTVGAVDSWLLTGFGNSVENDLVQNSASSGNRSATYGIKTVQAHLCFENNTPLPVRGMVALFFIPNLDQLTADSVDRLVPRIEYFKGTPNLKFDGIFGGDLLKMSDGQQASARTCVVCDQKRFTIPPGRNFQTVGGGDPLSIQTEQTQPCKIIRLSKTYKRLKKLYYNFVAADGNDREYMSNGNFYLAYCTDTIIPATSAQDGVKLWGSCGTKYVRLRPGVKDTGS